MSFLNPIKLPVKRYSSTDEGAPQIDLNNRTAGDVKTVFKACLVTGYSDKDGAGWSIVSEDTDNANIIFASPDTSMSEYVLGIDDSSTTVTKWYHTYQDKRIDLRRSDIAKNFQYTDTRKGMEWDLFVTDRGIYYCETVMHQDAQQRVSRLLYWGAIKSALIKTDGENIAFWCIGYNATYTFYALGSAHNYVDYKLADYTNLKISSSNKEVLEKNSKQYGVCLLDTISAVYLVYDSLLLAQHPALLLCDYNNLDDMPATSDQILNDRPVFAIRTSISTGNANSLDQYKRVVMIYTDVWDY